MTFGHKNRFAFELPNGTPYPDLTDINIWISGRSHALNGCDLQVFLLRAHQFYRKQQQPISEQWIDYFEKLDSDQAYHEIYSAIFPEQARVEIQKILPNKALPAFVKTTIPTRLAEQRLIMNDFSDAFQESAIIVLDGSNLTKRIAFCQTSAGDHSEVECDAFFRLEATAFHTAFSELLQRFEILENFSDQDWKQWGEKYSRGFGSILNQ